MEKLKGMIGNWKTTVIGLLPLVIGILNQFKVIDITPESGVDAASNLFDATLMLMGAITSLLGLVSRDADKTSEQSKAGPKQK